MLVESSRDVTICEDGDWGSARVAAARCNGRGRASRAAAEVSVPVASAALEVAANSRCTTRSDLIGRVRTRSPRVRFIADSNALAIRVNFPPRNRAPFWGHHALSPGTKPAARQVRARSCTEAADAVALIIAVTLDPTSADHPTSASTLEATPAGSAADSSPDSSGDKTSAPTTAATSEKDRPSPSSSTEPSVVNDASSRTSQSRGTFGAQLAAQSFFGPAPEVMSGVALYAMFGVDRPALFSSAVVLGASHVWRTGIEQQGGTASFTFDAVSVDACPFRLPLGAIEARPCGSALLGRLSARGTDTLNPADERTRPFWTVGGAVIVTADLPWLLEASLRFAVGANLVRDSFEFTPAIFHDGASHQRGSELRHRPALAMM